MKSKKRQQIMASKRVMKERRMQHPGYKSRYARKREFLNSNGGWGFDYAEPKPWK